MGYVVRMIHRVVRVLCTCTLISLRHLNPVICMFMSVKFFRSGQRRLMRFNNSGQTVGAGESNRRDDRPKCDHNEHQPPHTQYCQSRQC